MRKCKGEGKVRAIAVPVTGGHRLYGVGQTGAQHVEHLACKNAPDYAGPGVQLLVGKHVDRPGMQLFPDLATILPGQLRDSADVGPFVLMQNHSGGNWSPYRYLDLDAARELADLIDNAR